MAESTETAAAAELSFKVKTTGVGLHSITILESAKVLDLKTKLSGEEYENVPVDRMRLIYSGRVMKNEEPLSTYKIKNGNTIHMVKSAPSNPAPASGASSSATPAQPAVPANMSAGTSANNPLDNLTGARYAGFANLPSADMFGPNGGMGPPPSMDDIADMFSNPQAAQAMNEAMSNPAFIDMMVQNNPMLRNVPNAREVLQSQLPALRHLMSDPEAMRSMMRMRSILDGGGAMSDTGGFPAPGVTNTTQGGQAAPGQQQQDQQQANPFAGLFGGSPLANPFAAQLPPYVRSAPSAGAGAATDGSNSAGVGSVPGDGTATSAAGSNSQAQPGANSPPPGNPFASLLQAMGQAGAPGAGAGAGGMPPFGMSPQAMEAMLRDMGLSGAATASPTVDNRPPEERYADQLRQLNDMGFTDFDRNIAALRRSGGSVQGAIEYLLS